MAAANNTLKRLAIILIGGPVSFPIANWLVIILIAKSLEITVYSVPIILSSLGSIALIGLFFYIIFYSSVRYG